MSDNTKRGSGADWIKCIISAVVTIAMVIWLPTWFWLGLPFVCTYFVSAMKWI